MRVAKGYKQTELGEIPEDWHFKTFGEVMKGFSSGQTPSRSIKKYFTGKIPWITSGELNYNEITDTIEKITENAAVKTHLKVLPVGTFLMAITGLEAEGTRGSCGITGVPATTNQSCMALYPNEKDLTTEYLFQFYVQYGNLLAFKYCQGTKQQSYTGKIAKTLPIILPPTVEEQNAITNSLRETDAFLADLEKLILKKQNIKLATMQVLLTGKKRLKGFRDEWQPKKLSELLDYEQPVNYLVKNTEYNISTGIPVLTANKSFILGYTDEMEGVFEKVPVIIFDDFTTASRYVTFPFKIKSSAIKILKPKSKEVDLRFVFEKIQRIQFSIGDHKRYYISEYQNILMEVPSPDEQREISKVINDMDAEIEQLQELLSKYKSAKQGMMQNLLTGKTRLV